MNGNGDRENEEGKTDAHPPSQTEATQPQEIGAPGVQSGGTDHKEGGKTQLTETESQLAERIKRSDLWMISLTGVIAMATIANIVVFYKESEGSARDIREFASKAGDMVTAVNKSLAEDRAATRDILKENREALLVSRDDVPRRIDGAPDVIPHGSARVHDCRDGTHPHNEDCGDHQLPGLIGHEVFSL